MDDYLRTIAELRAAIAAAPTVYATAERSAPIRITAHEALALIADLPPHWPGTREPIGMRMNGVVLDFTALQPRTPMPFPPRPNDYP